MNGSIVRFTAPKTIESMTQAFAEHCNDGGADFIEHLKDWHKSDALATVNDAVQNHTAEAAVVIIKEALRDLFEIAAEGHRAALESEWEGVE